MPRRDTRARLLDAAVAIVRRDGPAAVTLDAVAEQAGVSKGGLLYHFKSKRALLDAMVAGWLAEFDSEIAAAGGRTFAGGYVRATDMSGWAAADRATEFGFLAALVDQPGLERVREHYGALQERVVGESDDPVQATVARLAADGLWLADLLGLAPPEGELRGQVRARLVELAGG